ncbi:hypothetical protein D3C86_1544960 [compost metagenome]
MAGAKIVDRDHHAQTVQLFEQLMGHGRGLNELALGQLQHQVDRARVEGLDELATILDQIQVLAVAGGYVDAYMKGFCERGGQGRQQRGGLLHQ